MCMHSLGQELHLTTNIILGKIARRNGAVNLVPYINNITYVSLNIIFLNLSV
jgi:hypothetical protein